MRGLGLRRRAATGREKRRSSTGGGPLLLNQTAALLCAASGTVSLTRLIKAGEVDNQWRLHLYVMAWFVVLVGLLWIGPGPGIWLLAVPAFYRLQDLLFASVGDALRLSKDFDKFDATARVLILFVNVLEIVLIFAIAGFALVGKNASAGSAYTSRLGSLYRSWNALPPLGGGVSTSDVTAQALNMTESAVGLLVVVIALGAFLGRPSGPSRNSVSILEGDLHKEDSISRRVEPDPADQTPS